MKPTHLEPLISAAVSGVWLISESEHPFSYIELGQPLPGEVARILAQRHEATEAMVKTQAPENFLSKIERAAATDDAIIAANAQKIKALLQMLQQHLAAVTIYRIENGVSIPIYILGFLPDGSCAGVSSTSIET